MSQKAHLVGYLKPTADPEGFLLPAFQVAGNNSLSTQRIDKNGSVAGFDQVFPQELREAPIDAALTVSAGEAAIWGYADKSGNARLEPRPALQIHLRSQLTETRDPFLQLQIARFCDADAELATAWRSAFSHLDQYSPRSALAWRDMVVLPGAIRAAVAEVARDHGIIEDNGYWDDAVETLTRSDRLHLLLASDLYRLFQNVPLALAQLEDRTRLVRGAFEMKTDSLHIAEMGRPDGSETSKPAPSLSRFSLISLGRMAETVAYNLFPTTVDGQTYLGRKPPGRTAQPDLVLVIRDYAIAHVEQFSCNLTEFDIGKPDELFIMFALGPDHDRFIEPACALAETYRARGIRVTAIIPHLPDHLFEASQNGTEIPARLFDSFDGIWFLGDRSPDVRQTLPYGPGHSPLAASRHLEFLLGHRSEWNEDPPRPYGADIIVAGSAAGARKTSVLLEQAFLRLLHAELGLEDAYELVVATGVAPQRHTYEIESSAERHFPEASLMLAPIMRVSGGHAEVLLAARVASMRTVSERQALKVDRHQ